MRGGADISPGLECCSPERTPRGPPSEDEGLGRDSPLRTNPVHMDKGSPGQPIGFEAGMGEIPPQSLSQAAGATPRPRVGSWFSSLRDRAFGIPQNAVICNQTWSQPVTSASVKPNYSFYRGEEPGENDVLDLDAEVVVLRKRDEGKPKYDTKRRPESVASSRWTSAWDL